MCFPQREETGLEFLKPAEVYTTAISFSCGRGYIAYASGNLPAAEGDWAPLKAIHISSGNAFRLLPVSIATFSFLSLLRSGWCPFLNCNTYCSEKEGGWHRNSLSSANFNTGMEASKAWGTYFNTSLQISCLLDGF